MPPLWEARAARSRELGASPRPICHRLVSGLKKGAGGAQEGNGVDGDAGVVEGGGVGQDVLLRLPV